MQPGDLTTVIYDRGCLRSGEEWVERNLVPVAVFAVAIAVLQVNEKKKSSLKFSLSSAFTYYVTVDTCFLLLAFLCLNLLYTTFHYVDIVYFMIFYVRL